MQLYYIRTKIVTISLLILGILLVGGVLHGYFQEDVTTINPIYIGNTGEKAVALMVNVDWGEEILPRFLAVLEEKMVNATFFITGRFAKKYPELTAQIFAAGHEIGNHGYSHPHPDKLSVEQNKKEILDTEKVFRDLKVEWARIFASPYGEHGLRVLQAAHDLGYKTIMWTLDTIDWQEPSPETIMERVLSQADNGALILLHPKECTVEVLPELIDALRQEGFSFKKVTEIIS